MSANPKFLQPQFPNEASRSLIDLMNEGVADSVAPGMVLLIGRSGQLVFGHSAGRRYSKPDVQDEKNLMSVDTVFDVGALTSTLVTTTLIMKLVESGKLKLDDKVSRYVQGYSVLGKSAVTIGHLLSHCGGLVSWLPYYEELIKANTGARLGVVSSRGAKDYIVNALTRMPLKSEAGSKQVYSELGILLLGHIVEMLTGMSLDKAAQKIIFMPLGMRSTSYIDLSMIKRRGIHPVTDLIAPTEECSWRKRILCGEVHDENCWVMGGIAGHSGLFSSALDIHTFCAEMLAAYKGNSNFLKRQTILEFWQNPALQSRIEESGEGWQYGWDTPGKENGLENSKLGRHAVGACSFTGCSMWIEPDLDLDIILLTNRVHPSRSNKKIVSFRSSLHSRIIETLKGL